MPDEREFFDETIGNERKVQKVPVVVFQVSVSFIGATIVCRIITYEVFLREITGNPDNVPESVSVRAE